MNLILIDLDLYDKEETRNMIIEETILTEESYIKNLEAIKEVKEKKKKKKILKNFCLKV